MSGLDACRGLAFSIGRDGAIQDIGAPNWNAYANKNDAPDLDADNVLGKNFFDFINGVQVKD